MCSIDLFPTLLEACGLEQSQDAPAIDGVSLVPVLKQSGTLAREALFWHYPHYGNQGGVPGAAIRDGDWKLIEFYAGGRRELFNLRDDPGEKVNLVARRPDVAKRLQAKLSAWRKQTGAVVPWKNVDADPNWPGFQLTGEERPTPLAASSTSWPSARSARAMAARDSPSGSPSKMRLSTLMLLPGDARIRATPASAITLRAPGGARPSRRSPATRAPPPGVPSGRAGPGGCSRGRTPGPRISARRRSTRSDRRC